MFVPVRGLMAFLAGLLLTLPVLAADIEDILALKEAPAGVVFEVISGDRLALELIIPMLQKDIQKLRKKFPQLPIALVSHGQEQFSLLSQHETKYAKTHSLTRQLVEDDVEVHVCGTHASWYSFSEEDYPDFLDVAPAAPAQINDYIKLGYIHVEL